ncbi:dihydroneopterin aldolase [Thiomicrospira sp. S5]|uniref:dihydroneopterin aldolase n=1 Tax=Thiomicrospira sp. S5 TaxID=1803865 RepID=UPI000F89FA3C|nr:dihydroneopterin aldolase [Thiomicrospira sp. S5]AZR81377.1 dihydroneopterin aldolase [Thiomicrospira sp. S5]AZR81546.1 dihydroneopterin aldolase [Thiomicrospira sp. S5]
MTQDTIFVQGLKTQAIIGVYDWEKQFRQPLIFDLALSTDLRAAANSDRLADTVNYKAISDEIIELVAASRFELIESLAEAICQHLFEHHAGVSAIELTLHKPNAVIEADSVGLKIRRQR